MSAMSSAVTDPATGPATGPAPARRRVVLVTGPGRSGATALAGALRTLGMHVPQPEVEPAPPVVEPPRVEPQWVVDWHEEHLARLHVDVDDARPRAWFRTGKAGTREDLRSELHAWLEQQLAEGGPELVLKDPRLTWFLGVWRSAALRCDATPSFVTVLRPVPEVVASGREAAPAPQATDVARTAAWINIALHTERATRGSQRAMVRYADLLADWTVPVSGLGERFGLDAVRRAHTNDLRKVHQLIDPALRRSRATWADLDVPARLRELAQESWEALDRLVDPAGDAPAAHAVLDDLRAAYAEHYRAAETLASASVVAARRAGFDDGVASVGREYRTPHWVRAAVPEPVRKGLRRGVGRAAGRDQ